MNFGSSSAGSGTLYLSNVTGTAAGGTGTGLGHITLLLSLATITLG